MQSARFLGAWCVFVLAGVFESTAALIPVGAEWRYFKGVEEPGGAGGSVGWNELGFDDLHWPTGRSGFSAGYTYGEATPMTNMGASHGTVLFRKTFHVQDPKAIEWLVLRVDYDDGFAAYLNGREVARRNIPGEPGTPVPFAQRAAGPHPRAAPEEIDLAAGIPLLRSGENVLAIQAHTLGAGDFSFLLLPELLANFTRGPFIQNASSNRVDVLWKTAPPTRGSVEYGPSPALGFRAASTGFGTNHAARLESLLPDALYYYRVESEDGDRTARSPVESFRTLKTEGSLSFVVFGDSGLGSAAQYDVARVIEESKPDLVLHAGDVIYPLFSHNLTDSRCLSVYRPHMKSTPYFFAMGNHDLYGGEEPYLEAFSLPTNSVTGKEHYYSFDHGDAHFAVLFVPYISQYRLTEGDPQYEWLANDLAASRKRWKFLVFHHPMITSGLHRRDDFNFNGIPDRVEVRDVILPLARRHGVQMTFAGHDHSYERIHPTNGVHSIVTGGGGVYLYPMLERDAGSAQFWSRHHCVRVRVSWGALRLEAVDQTGVVFDSMTLHREEPLRSPYLSSWHSPQIEAAAGSDGDGNIPNQTFDFIGEPIPTAAGDEVNLGSVQVNNDDAYLYVGFRQAMIYPHQNLFLFAGVPGADGGGVNTMRGIGNGRMDSEGQGADGLDCLENLAFSNFYPSVACLLGDEFGDGQMRSFTRPGLALNIGQGMFHLTADLEDVRGARIQQFNRSPQGPGALGEQNADWIEAAIPLNALAGARPGGLVRIGAVVGGKDFNFDPEVQSRALENGFLGYALTRLETGMAALEGITVRLAINPDDPDADGLVTSREAELGTDPRNPDSDGDGLRDDWEVLHGLDPLRGFGMEGGEGDPDGDGVTNLEEQTAGTAPRDANSFLRIRIGFGAADGLELSWPTVVGAKYRLVYSEDPSLGFVVLPGGHFPRRAFSTNQVYREGKPFFLHRFYRVEIVP